MRKLNGKEASNTNLLSNEEDIKVTTSKETEIPAKYVKL